MKIKGSAENLKINSAFIVFLIGTVLAVGIRIYQGFSGLIDFETGFLNEEHISTYILYAVLIVSAFAIFIISLLAGEVPQDKMPEKRSPALAVFSALFGVALAFDGVSKIEGFTSASKMYDITYTEQTYLSFLMKSGALPKMLTGVFAFISTVYFLVIFIKYIGIKNVNLTKVKALSLCPLFWATFRMIERFTRTISFMNVSGLMLELFMISFMMMFFMYLAQTSSEVNATAISYKVFAYGLIGSMLASVVTLPRVILLAVNSDYMQMMADGELECPLEMPDVAFIFFTLMFLVCFVSSPKIRNMTLKETEKMIEE